MDSCRGTYKDKLIKLVLASVYCLCTVSCSNDADLFQLTKKQNASEDSESSQGNSTPSPDGNDINSNENIERVLDDIYSIEIAYDPLTEKERIELIILASDLTQEQKEQAIDYVRNSHQEEIKTVGSFVKKFIEGLIETLPNNSKDTLEIVAESTFSATNNVSGVPDEKIAEIRQQILQDVLLQTAVKKQVDSTTVQEVTQSIVEKSGYFLPDQVATITQEIADSIIKDQAFIDSQNAAANANIDQVDLEPIPEPEVIPEPDVNSDTGNTPPGGNGTLPVAPNEEPAQLNLLANDSFVFWAHYEAEGTIAWENDEKAIVDVTKLIDGQIWHHQLVHRVTLVKDQNYEASFDVSAVEAVEGEIVLGQNAPPYSTYHKQKFDITNDVNKITFPFTYTGPEEKIRFIINFGGKLNTVTFDKLTLKAIETGN